MRLSNVALAISSIYNTGLAAGSSLYLDFLSNNQTLDPRITFTRASSATYFGSDGLLKTTPVNLLTYSEQFDNAAWVKALTTALANTAVSPGGDMTADLITETATTGNHAVIQSGRTITAGSVQSFSVFAKNASGTRWVMLTVVGASGTAYCHFNPSTGAVGISGVSGTYTGVSGQATSFGDGWYRFNVSFTTATDTSVAPEIRFKQTDGGVSSYAGDGTSGIYIWGAQLETGSTASAYIPTTATSSGAPRFDYDPVTLQPKGLLIEEQRTNLCLQSQALATSPWATANVASITNNTTDVVSPDGLNTATKIVRSGASTASVLQAVTMTATVYDGSIWLKCATGTLSATITVYLSASPFTSIGVSNVTLTTDWQRFSLVTTTATAASYNFQLNINAIGTVYAWGAQLEAGAFPTSYIPTTTAAATRAADVATMTGANFSNWYNQTEGTLFVEAYRRGEIKTVSHMFGMSDGSTANRIRAFYNTDTQVRLSVITSSAEQGPVAASITPDAVIKFASAYKTNDLAISINGGLPATDATASIPSNLTSATLGANTPAGDAVFNGYIRRIAYFPRRLSNTELQAITA